MAWTRIQSASAAATGTASTKTATFTTANASAGTKIIAAVGCWLNGHANTVITSVEDAASNPLTLIGRVTTGTTMDVSLWAMDTPAGDVGLKPAITVTASVSVAISLVIQEVSGLLAGNTTVMADGTLASNSGNGGSSTGSPTYSSTAASEYLVSVYGDDGGPETWTAPAALTADVNDVNSNSNATAAIAYGNSTGGAESASWALTGTATNWGTLLVAFKLASTGSPAPLHPRSQPVTVAGRHLPARGRARFSPGQFSGTGPPLRPLRAPVQARRPVSQRYGRVSKSYTASAPGTPVAGIPSQPKPYVFRSPTPHRAVTGNNMQCGDGVAAPLPVTVTVATAYQQPPRSRPGPATARAHTGSLGLCAAGIASTVVTSRGSPAPRRPAGPRSASPRRASVGGAAYGTSTVAASPVTLRAASTASTGTTAGGAAPLNFTIPAGTQPGDILVIWCYAGTSSVISWSATGWTAVTVVSGTSGACQLLYRVATGAEGSTVTVTCSAPEQWAGVIAGYYNINSVSPFDPAPASGQINTSSTTVAAGSITTTLAGDKLLWFGAIDAGSGGTPAVLTVPSGFTAEVTQVSTSAASGTNVGVIFGDVTKATAGATGAENGTAASGHVNAGCLISVADQLTATGPAVYQRPPGCGSGIASPVVTPPPPAVPAPSMRPAIRSLPPRRGLIPSGNTGTPAGGIRGNANAAPVPLPPLPRPVIQHVPMARARLGNNLACGDGVAAPVSTPPGSPSHPKPYVWRSPAPRRAITGNNGQCGDGIAALVNQPPPALGVPQPTAPLLEFRPALSRGRWGGVTGPGNAATAAVSAARPQAARSPAPRRALWHGLASQTVTPLGTASRPKPFVFRGPPPHRAIAGNNGQCGDGSIGLVNPPAGTIPPARKVPLFPPRIFRARIGRGTVSGGITAGPNLPPGAGAYQRTPPVIKRPALSRALTGHGGVAGGVRGLVNQPLSSALGQQHAWVARSPVPRRAIAGSNLLCGDGIASAVSTPLGLASRPKPFIFRSPTPHRGLLGNNLACGDGIASGIITPLSSAPSPPPRPVIQHLPPRRARVGNNVQCGDGIASTVSTPPGVIAPPRLLLPWVSHPHTRALTGHGTVAGGIAGLVNPPLGTPNVPRPVIAHVPPRRALVPGSNAGTPGGGIGSRAVTPLGSVGPPHPFVARKGPHRAQAGNNLQAGDGIASAISTPLGSPPALPLRPAITRVLPVRAHTGPLGRNAGGLAAPAAAPMGATAARRPPGSHPQPPHRALVGNNLTCGDGLAGLVNPPLGTIAPRRVRQPWVSRPQSRALAKGNPAPGPRVFTEGPGTVIAADSATQTVRATDRQVMTVGAGDWQVMDVTAADYEP